MEGRPLRVLYLYITNYYQVFKLRVSSIFSGIEPKIPEFLHATNTRPEKTRPIKRLTRPEPVRFGFNPGTRSVRVPDLPPYYLQLQLRIVHCVGLKN